MDGFHVPKGTEPWWDPGVVPGFVEKGIRIFIFSFSLSTTFGGARVEARSPYALLLANLNTLMAQLMFVFFSGAGKTLTNSLLDAQPFLNSKKQESFCSRGITTVKYFH